MSDLLHMRLWSNAAVVSSAAPTRRNVKIVEGLRECPCCGLFQTVPKLRRGQVAYCKRCDEQLSRRGHTPPIATPAAFCIASAALYLALLLTQLLTINVHGRVNTVTMFTGPIELEREGFGEIGFIVAMTTLVMPGVVIALMGAILAGVSRRQMPDWAPRLMSWYERLREWSMIEVYILGVFVAYTKLIDLAIVDLQAGVYLIAALMLTMAATDSTLDVERIWQNRDIREEMEDGHGRALGVDYLTATKDSMPPVETMLSCHSCGLVIAFDHDVVHEVDRGECPRCHQTLRRRKANSLANAAALLLAGIICYIPANLLPIMSYTKMGRLDTSTIIHGVIELWQSDLVPLALLILFASILVPVLKIISLAIMVIATWFGQKRGLRQLAKLYRLIDLIGRWSMIDVFMIAILVSVVNFNFLANVVADSGIVFFTIVVIVTIFAVHSFDPRSMWDAAGENGPVRRHDEKTQKSDRGGNAERDYSFPSHDMEPERA